MRAISLHQPWATAMALGLKRIETRDWRPAVDEPFLMAIHAAKVWKPEQVEFCSRMRVDLCPELPHEIPLGAIVGVVRVEGFEQTDVILPDVSPIELLWGNYEPGRWAWLTEQPRALSQPLAWRGQQGFFSVPDSVLRGVL